MGKNKLHAIILAGGKGTRMHSELPKCAYPFCGKPMISYIINSCKQAHIDDIVVVVGSNIRFGCWYLNYLSHLFLGDPVAVTAAYHAGQGQVKVWLSDPNLSADGYTLKLSALPEGPTKIYAGRVTRDYGIYQEKYFSVDQLPADPDNADTGLSGISGNR